LRDLLQYLHNRGFMNVQARAELFCSTASFRASSRVPRSVSRILTKVAIQHDAHAAHGAGHPANLLD
jgi:hypothetical protein